MALDAAVAASRHDDPFPLLCRPRSLAKGRLGAVIGAASNPLPAGKGALLTYSAGRPAHGCWDWAPRKLHVPDTHGRQARQIECVNAKRESMMPESLSDICADYADDVCLQQLAKLAVLGIMNMDDLSAVTEKHLRDAGVLLGLISRFKKHNLIGDTTDDDSRRKLHKVDDDSRRKLHKVDWMLQLLDACKHWKDAVLKDDNIIEPLPWPFCPMKEEDAVMEETEDEGTGISEATKEDEGAVIGTNEFKLRLVNLGENLTLKAIWGKSSDLKIIERKAYIDLWSRIRCVFETEGRRPLLLLGNPGVGKTAFLLYVLLMLLQEKKKILMQTKGGQLYFFSYEGNQYSFNRPKTVYDTDLDSDVEIHYLVDEKLPDVPVYVGKCLLASTPLKSNFKEFEKDEGCLTFYLPVWSASEMSLLRQEVFSTTPKEKLEERYTQWGGIPRFVLEYPNKEMSKEIAKLTNIQELVYAVMNQKADEDHPAHKVIYMKVTANYEEFELCFTSPYVQERVFQKLHKDGLHTLKAFLMFNGSDIPDYPELQGGIFELFFKRMSARKVSFPVFEVFQTKGPAEVKNVDFKFGELKYVKTLDDVNPTTDQDRIIWPHKSNQETIDAFVLRKRTHGSYSLQGFQVTLSSIKGDHGLKYAGVLDLMNRFSIAADNVEVYMVTTDIRFKEVGYQSWRIKNNKVLRAKNILRKMECIRQFSLNCGGT